MDKQKRNKDERELAFSLSTCTFKQIPKFLNFSRPKAESLAFTDSKWQKKALLIIIQLQQRRSSTTATAQNLDEPRQNKFKF